MPKTPDQKLKLIYLMKILLEKTDESHYINMQEILSSLKAYGISAERKSIYSDMESLRRYGMDIIGEKINRDYCYRVGERQFELAELKMLVDCVQSAKFITEKKSAGLIRKLERLGSRYEAGRLHRQVYVAGRIKTMNESIYYNVDRIHEGIAANKKIRFQYFQWNVKKKMELRRGGEYYEISPWALSCDDENYYLIAFDDREDKIKHFRVDKMLHIDCMEEQREGKEKFCAFDMAAYAKKTFGMYGGEEERVKLLCDNRMAGVMIDRFGKEISLIPADKEHFFVNVKVAVSRQFLGWIFALGEGVKIVEPEKVVKIVGEEIKRLENQYK